MNVLIVEDELLIAADLAGIVEDIGFRVVAIASSLEQALAHAPRATVALVDLKLADGASGAQLARRLIDRYGMQVIIVTGNPGAIGAGFDGALDVISKPFASERLVKALRKAQALAR
ncbi:response regulator [Agrobacterium larrymoorei]|uniref:response regulator n=1 Tax=Agrobacterium larrymoorei TaxID=160699 RepID=UPI0030C054C1